jgi:hypothetical protein
MTIAMMNITDVVVCIGDAATTIVVADATIS